MISNPSLRIFTLFILLICYCCGISNATISNSRRTNCNPYRYTFQRADAGGAHTAEIKNGKLYTSGSNSFGQLGIGNLTNHNAFIQVGTDTKWTHVSCGSTHTVAIKSDGTLWAWGNNIYGQLGIGNNISQSAPVQVGTDTKWVMVSCGLYYTTALKADGTIWGWGDNTYGQLGTGNTTPHTSPVAMSTDIKWVAVAAGDYTTIALRAHGNLWAWGYNANNLLGQGSIPGNQFSAVQVGGENRWMSISIGENSAAAIRADGSLAQWGGTGPNIPLTIGSDNNWVQVAVGQNHTLGLKSNGTLWAWGTNVYGQLGTGNPNGGATPVQVGTDNNWVSIAAGFSHSLAVKADGRMYTWGDNSSGQLGIGNFTQQTAPAIVDTLGNVFLTVVNGIGDDPAMNYSGNGHSLALHSDGTLWGWGDNTTGQLGIGNTTAHPTIYPAAAGNTWVSVATSVTHTLAIKADGTLWAWGKNNYGQLGIGNSADQLLPVQVGTDNNWTSIYASYNYSIAIKGDGSLWGWGNNASLQLGTGGNTSYNMPVMVNSDNQWISASCAGDHGVALESDGTISAWGQNAYGQLGFNNTASYNYATQIGADTKWAAVTSGSKHSLGIKSDGTLWAWGNNSSGQLGLGNTTQKLDPQQVGTDTKWVSVYAGYDFTAALKSDGTLWTWGNNVDGALGNGTYTNATSPASVSSQAGVVQLFWGSAATHNAIIKVARDEICLAGTNLSQQLSTPGLGNNSPTFVCVFLILPTVTIVASPADTVCPGATVTFTATSTYSGINPSYQWQINGNNAGSNSPTFTTNALNNNDTVTCLLYSNMAGAFPVPVKSNKIVMTVSSVIVPSVTISASKTLICNGSVVTFTAIPHNAGPSPSYQWQLNGVNVGTNSSTYATNALNSGDTITCHMIGSNPCGNQAAATSNVVTIVVNPVPLVSITVSTNPICAGTIDTFRAVPTYGGSSPTYKWLINGQPSSATDSVFYYSALTTGSVVTLQMTSSADCATPPTVTSNAITLNVTPSAFPGINVNTIPPTAACTGTLIHFVTNTNGAGANPSYKWFKSGVQVGTNSPTYQDNTLSNGDTVVCFLTSSQACAVPNPVSSNKVGLSITPITPAQVAISASPGTGFNPGDLVTFSAVNVNGGTTPAYQWLKNGNVIAGATNATYITSNMQVGDVFSVRMQSNAPCAVPNLVTSNELTMHSSTGINSIGNWNGEVTLYPNPNAGSFNLAGIISEDALNQPIRITIMNAVGQLIYQTTTSPGNTNWTTAVQLSDNTANGIYLLHLTSGDHQFSKSFIVGR